MTSRSLEQALQVVDIMSRNEQLRRDRLNGDVCGVEGDEDPLVTLDTVQGDLMWVARDLEKHKTKSAVYMTAKVMDKALADEMDKLREGMTQQVEDMKAQNKMYIDAFKVKMLKDFSTQVATVQEEFKELLNESTRGMSRQIKEMKTSFEETNSQHVEKVDTLVNEGRKQIETMILAKDGEREMAHTLEMTDMEAKISVMTQKIAQQAVVHGKAWEAWQARMREIEDEDTLSRVAAFEKMTKSIRAQDQRFKTILDLFTKSQDEFRAEYEDDKVRRAIGTPQRQLGAPQGDRGAPSRGSTNHIGEAHGEYSRLGFGDNSRVTSERFGGGRAELEEGSTRRGFDQSAKSGHRPVGRGQENRGAWTIGHALSDDEHDPYDSQGDPVPLIDNGGEVRSSRMSVSSNVSSRRI